jgi:hypothetical protein
MSFHFMRMQEDGRITPIMTPQPVFPTIKAAKEAAPGLLIRMRPGARGSKIVLVQVIEDVKFTATVTYEKWSDATMRKHGLGPAPIPTECHGMGKREID